MITAMRNAGLDPGGVIIPDGKLHRFDVPGDRPKSGNGWYVMYDGDVQAGRFGSWKTGQNEKWCSKTATEFTPEQKAVYRQKMEEARQQRENEQKILFEQCREWCRQAWESASPAKEDHPYLLKKNVKPFGLKQYGDKLMIPVGSHKAKDLHGIQFIAPDGTKKFKTGTDKKAHFHVIGKPLENTVIICEGYATGASIHQATGHAAIIAFDAGNLKPVAEFIRSVKPEIKIIIAADDDRWTDNNPGITKALEAAKAVSGEMRRPLFTDVSTKPTDFNDLHSLSGQDAVKRSLFPPPMEEYAPPPLDNDYEPPPPTDPEEYSENPLNNAPFQLLGYNHGEYYYLPKGAPQVKALTADRHSAAHLVSMAPLQWWERNYPGKQSFDTSAAANALLRAHEKIGVYDNRRIRGRGAWEDKGRTVLHLGNTLVVDGKKTPLSEHRSRWIYEAGSPIELDGINNEPMSNAEAHKLVELCKKFNWDRPDNAMFLAGWMAIAPICGVLPWRPHILITGAAGSGKSTVSDMVIRPVVGPSAITCMGNTTEAGLRGEAGSDARAVLFDEAESGGEHSRRMQAVLELARQSSSDIGYSILKGSQSGKSVKYLPRLCFCFSSIGAAATQQADNDRITTLSLVKDDRPGHDDRWHSLQKNIVELLTPEYCQSLRARQYSIIQPLISNVKIFSRLLGVKLSSQRKGDQYGAFLAGAYSLHSRNVVTDETAQEFISKFDFDDSLNDKTNYDEEQCLGVILQHQIRVDSTTSITIGELLATATSGLDSNRENSRTILLRHGIRVTDTLDGFAIANKHTALDKILEKTPWSKNWGHILARLTGSVRMKPICFTTGVISRAVMLPVSILRGGGE